MAKFSRRRAMKMLGLGAGLVPLLSEGVGRSAEPAFPKRLIVMCVGNGMLPGTFWPTGSATDFTFPWAAAPLQAHKDKLLVVKGIRIASAEAFGGGEHKSLPFLLSGGPAYTEGDNLAGSGHATIDQFVADRIADETTLPWKSMVIGVKPDDHVYGATSSRLSWTGSNQPVTPIRDPWELAADLFASVGDDAQAKLAALTQKHTLLGSIKNELAAYEKMVSAEDRQALQAHLAAVEEIEQRFDPTNQVGANCAEPVLGPALDYTDYNVTDQVSEAFIDIVAAALACDATRVVSFMWRNATGGHGTYYPWLGEEFVPTGDTSQSGQSGDAVSDHNLVHDSRYGDPWETRRAKRDLWFVEQFARLIDKLDAIPEGDGTLLDNTAIVFTSHAKDGRHTNGTAPIPLIIAGGCGGALRQGQMVEWDQGDRPPNNRLLTTLAHAMDTPTDEFGDAAYDATPLSELLV